MGNGSGVTEVDIQTGALVRIMSTGQQSFSVTTAMVVVGPDLFVLGHGLGSGSLVEFDCSTGRLVRVLTGAMYRFSQPDAMALAGTDLFVANAISSSDGSVTEINTSTGALVRVLMGSRYQFDWPAALAVAGPRPVGFEPGHRQGRRFSYGN